MKYNITYRNVITGQEYTLGKVEADNINEATKIAKNNRGVNEKVVKIEPLWESIFEDLLGEIQTGFGGLFK